MREVNKPLTEKEYWSCKHQELEYTLHYRAALKWLRTYLYTRMDKIFRESLPVASGVTFLEVGCGGGKWLVYFNKRYGYRVSGIDYSEQGVLTALKTASFAKIEAEVIHDDVFTADIKNKYDVVLSDGFLEHFIDTKQTLERLASFVKKGGYLVTIVPNLRGVHGFLLRQSNHGKRVFKTHKVITKKELLLAYEALGFQGIRFFEIGSIIPKIFALPGIISKTLNGFLRIADVVGIHFEGEKISSTYLVLGKR